VDWRHFSLPALCQCRFFFFLQPVVSVVVVGVGLTPADRAVMRDTVLCTGYCDLAGLLQIPVLDSHAS
jgi:hypothetical protein